MANIFGDLSYARYANPYVGTPVEEVDQLGQVLDARYQANRAASDKFIGQLGQVDVRDPNRSIIMEAGNKARQGIRTIAERGDYENAASEITGIVTEFANNPLVVGAMKDKQQFDAWNKAQQERIGAKENGITQDQFNKSYALATKRNNTAVEYDQKTGAYKNLFSGYKPVETQNIGDDMMKVVENWKASKQPIKFVDASGNEVEIRNTPQGYFNMKTQEYVDDKEVFTALQSMVYSNPQYQAYIDEQIMFDMFNQGIGLENGKAVTQDDFKRLGYTPEKIQKFAEDHGWDYNTILEDPLMMEGIFKAMTKQDTVNKLIAPATAKAGYTIEEDKFLTDNVFMEGLKHRNAMALEGYKQNRMDARQRTKLEFEKNLGAPITISNPGTVINGEEFEPEALKQDVLANQQRLDQINRNLETHKTNSPVGNYNELIQQKRELENLLKVQNATHELHSNSIAATPEGIAVINKEYDKYKLLAESKGKIPMTKEQFQFTILKTNGGQDVDLNANTGIGHTWNMIRSGMPLQFAISAHNNPMYEPDPDKAIALQLAMSSKKLINTKPATSSLIDTPVNKVGNVLSAEDKGVKSPYVFRMNEALTKTIMSNGGDYTVYGGVQFDDYLKEKTGDKKGFEVQVSVGDVEVGGTFPHFVKIVDKEGNTIHQTYVFPKSGGAEERYNVGVNLMKENPVGSDKYVQGNYMAASGRYPNLARTSVEPYLASVSNSSPITAEPASYDVNVGGYNLRIVKQRQQFRDETGMPQGTNTIYRMGMVGPDGKVADWLVNTSFGEGNKIEDTYFMNYDDLLVGFYNKMNTPVTTPTGPLKSVEVSTSQSQTTKQ